MDDIFIKHMAVENEKGIPFGGVIIDAIRLCINTGQDVDIEINGEHSIIRKSLIFAFVCQKIQWDTGFLSKERSGLEVGA